MIFTWGPENCATPLFEALTGCLKSPFLGLQGLYDLVSPVGQSCRSQQDGGHPVIIV
jgi:hypothetical protein